MSINAITLIVDQPSAVAGRLRDAFGWTVTQDFGAFAEVTIGDGAMLWLNVPGEPTAAVQQAVVQQGVIIHCWVDDVPAATEQARAAGAAILREPTAMDFGMESALAQVDGGPVVDLTRPL